MATTAELRTLHQQWTRYNGRRYRLCVYRVAGGRFAGFVETPTVLIGYIGAHDTERAATLEGARVIAAHAAGVLS